MKKNYTKIVLDFMMAITFVLLMNPRVLNGLPFHEVAGLAIGAALFIHVGLNYRWVINTARKIFGARLPKKTRFSFVLNILLLISMGTVIITGILISRVAVPSLAIQGSRAIRGIHSFSADATLALVGLHIAVHWQWVMSICKRAFKTKEGKFRTGVIASVVLSIVILAGGIQWYATSSSNKGDLHPGMQQRGKMPEFEDRGNAMNTHPGPPNGDFHGRDGHGGSSSPFLVVLNYFAIWAAIIIPVYYLEKRIFRDKRKQKSVQPKVTG